MNWLRKLRTRFRALFVKRKLDAEMDKEMRTHLELQTRANMADGMSPEEARFASPRQFGHVDGIKEACREQRSFVWLETIVHDLRFGMRALRKHPFSNTIIVLTIGILIGAVSVIYASLCEDRARLEPFPEPDRLVKLWRIAEKRTEALFPGSLFQEYANELNSFETMGAIQWRQPLTLTGVGETASYSATAVTRDVFWLAGLSPIRGRLFDESEDSTGSERLVIISEQLWREKLEADPDIIGRDLLFDDQPRTVIGVMSAAMRSTHLGYNIDVWHLMRSDQVRQRANLTLVARLKPGVSLSQAQAEFDTLAPRIESQYTPGEHERRVYPGGFKSARVVPLGKRLSNAGNESPVELIFIWIFSVTIMGCVVGVACFNITNLLLARYSARSREIAIRLSLGARRLRVVRQLLTESVLLSFLGGILGLLTSFGIFELLRFQHVNPKFDVRLYLIVLVGTLVLGMLVGLLPAIRSSRKDLTKSLKEGGLSIGGRRRHRLRNFLVSSEVAMASLLCVAGGLMARSFLEFYRGELGFNPDRMVTVNVQLRSDRYPDEDDQIAYLERGLQALREMPGVEAATVSLGQLHGFSAMEYFSLLGSGETEEDFFLTKLSRVGPEFTDLLGMPVVRGRGFPEQGNARIDEVLVNETFAKRFFPESDAIGQNIRERNGNRLLTIVGVLRDRHQLMSFGAVEPEVFFDFRDNFASFGLVFIAQTWGSAGAMGAPVRESIARLDASQPVGQPATMSDLISQRLAEIKAPMTLLGSLAGFGLLIALTGVYGVVSFSVVERTREVGVRMAVGATRMEILRLMLWQGARLMCFGVPIGILVGALTVYGLPAEDMVGSISPWDLPTYASVLLLVGLIGFLASLLPARRATQINPMEALRTE